MSVKSEVTLLCPVLADLDFSNETVSLTFKVSAIRIILVGRNTLRLLRGLRRRLKHFVETSGSIHPVTQRRILEERISQTRRSEGLKSYSRLIKYSPPSLNDP